MYKVLRSYTRKAERKHDQNNSGNLNEHVTDGTNQHNLNRGAPYITSASSSLKNGGSNFTNQYNDSFQRNGNTAQYSDSYHNNKNFLSGGGDQSYYRQYDSTLSRDGAYQGRQGFSESSSYETREHYERKVQKSKKTRGERERRRVANNNGISEIKRVCFMLKFVSETQKLWRK